MKSLAFVVVLTLIGFLDASYLTYEHYAGKIPPCSLGALADCGQVLRSDYAVIAGVPLAAIGMIHYILFFCVSSWVLVRKSSTGFFILIIQSVVGFFASLYFIYLQLFVIHALCLYCMLSALLSIILFGYIQWRFASYRVQLVLFLFSAFYSSILKPLLFRFNPELVHETMVAFGEFFGQFRFIQAVVKFFVRGKHPMLAQEILGIRFSFPVGLSAGFDYEARLTQSLAAWGFGFQTVGTITNSSYQGNPRPMLGRLPLSRSLMVNKGFKNPGADLICSKLSNKKFRIPVGISIGRTNSEKLDQQASITDIISCFTTFENSRVTHTYYELNISCPNLFGSVSFYEPEELDKLLSAVDALGIQRPIFVKMPIDKSDLETEQMLSVIVRHSIAGVIFGNLQKDRNHPSLVPEEVLQFPIGNFSGKPTFDRSNELISLAYKKFGSRLVIIGCGGVFSAEDAYTKIRRGSHLVQLITGMIYEGPQLISSINFGLEELLRRDGFTSIGDAVGVDVI